MQLQRCDGDSHFVEANKMVGIGSDARGMVPVVLWLRLLLCTMESD